MKAKWFLHETLRKHLKGAKMSHKSLRQFASLFLALAIIFGGFTPVRADTNIQLIPMDDGCVFDQSPFDGFGDAVEYSLSVCSGFNPGIAEFRGAMEFDVSSITSSNAIESASLYVTPIGRSWFPGTSNMLLQLFGYTGNGVIGNDDFNAGFVIAIFDGLAIPINVPVILDVTEFLQNQAPTNYVGFGLRTDVPSGVDFGSLELGQAPILLITLSTTEVVIDIKPGSAINSVYLKSEGVIPVAILTTDDFDASTVDRDTVLFGVTGNEASPVHSALSDVDGDGDMDVIFHFNVMGTGLALGDTVAYLKGETLSGEPIEGSDSVNILNLPTKSTVIDLGTLGGLSSYAVDINERGQIIGASDVDARQRGFLWENGVMTDLGTLGGPYSYPVAINEHGQIVGNSDIASNDRHAFLWENGMMIDLGTLGGYQSYARAINERGQVIGYSQTDALSESHAFLWENGIMFDLGTLGGPTSDVYDINWAGQVVGDSTTALGQSHAFLWEKGTMIDLGTLDGVSSNAMDINARGQIVGTVNYGRGVKHTFLWENGVMTNLGTLGGRYSIPMSINDRGQIVGVSQTPSFEVHAFLWEKGSMIDLGTLGGTNSAPVAINNRGQIVGTSNTYSGEIHIFLWQNGMMTDLVSLSAYGSVSAINERGQIVGRDTTTSVFEQHAYLWER
jgi:probable HAF family extracellular repeat protein